MNPNTPNNISAHRISIQEIIKHKLVDSHFQAIVDLKTSKNLGFEALVRTSPKIPSIRPDQLFEEAFEARVVAELDYLCLYTALSSSKSKQIQSITFINVLPVNLKKLCGMFEPNADIKPLAGVAFEISERYPLDNFSEIKNYIKILRRCGALIAIDDLGAGYAGLKVWAEIQPDFVKIDRHFIDKIDTDNIKREFVRSILEISRGVGCKVIAEGIETKKELEVLLSIGITFGQGYLLHRPEESPANLISSTGMALGRSINHRSIFVRPAEKVASIMREVQPLSAELTLQNVYDIFDKDKSLYSLPIVKSSQPIGIITRSQLVEIALETAYFSKHDSKAITMFMDRSPIVVDINEDLEFIAYAVTSKLSPDLNVGVIITENNHYLGMASVSDVLKYITQNKSSRSRYSNSLTLLPSNVPVYEWLDKLLKEKENFRLAFLGIENIKSYNDVYGYSHGDDIIKLVADILVSNTSPSEDMVGHLGGDNFVIIFRADDWKSKSLAMIRDFSKAMPDFYNSDEIEKSQLTVKSCDGQVATCDLTSLSIGIVNPDPSAFHSYHDIIALATNAKEKAMEYHGSHLFISRRRNNVDRVIFSFEKKKS